MNYHSPPRAEAAPFVTMDSAPLSPAADAAFLSNVEAEAALVGALMCEPRLIDRIADRLPSGDFSDGLMADLYSAILNEHALGRPANPVTLRPLFAGHEGLIDLGGLGFLAELTENPAGVIGAEGFAGQIADLARRRRLAEGLKAALALAADPARSAAELIAATDAAIAAAAETGEGVHQPSGAECLDEVIAGFGVPQTGVTCGAIPAVDALLGPIRPKQLVIGAGRPGMGKTAFALSYALGAAERGHGVLFVSLEMSSAELGARMAADLCFGAEGEAKDLTRVPFAAIAAGRVSGEEALAVARARDRIAALPFQVVDTSGLSVGRLAMMVRRHKRRMAARGARLELVVVDYLQLLRPDQRTPSRYEAISEISMGLKHVAKSEGVGLLALAQLSREVEKRPDKRPQLADLRDSGQIEQDADGVLFLVRDEYYLRLAEPDAGAPERPAWDQAMAEAAGRIEFLLAKRRNGGTGRAGGRFHGAFQAVRG